MVQVRIVGDLQNDEESTEPPLHLCLCFDSNSSKMCYRRWYKEGRVKGKEVWVSKTMLRGNVLLFCTLSYPTQDYLPSTVE